MRKIHKICYVIWLVVGLSLFISGCPFKSGVEGKAWFQYASKYDQEWSKMAASGGALQDYNKVLKMEQKFLRAKQPTETEIISVLKSPNRRFQKIGLVAMSLKPIETEQLTEILFGFLQDNDYYFRTDALYSLNNFTKFPDSKKADLGKQLLEIMKNEKAKGIFLSEFNLLAKFPSEEAALFLTEQLMKEGKENYLFRNLAFYSLKKMGDTYYDQAAEYVKKHGSPELKKELLERESYRKTGKE
jgi:hypothetical protein